MSRIKWKIQAADTTARKHETGEDGTDITEI